MPTPQNTAFLTPPGIAGVIPGAIARLQYAQDYINAYYVYWDGPPNIRGEQDAPDILTWIQRNTPAQEAIGKPLLLHSLYNLDSRETKYIEGLTAVLNGAYTGGVRVAFDAILAALRMSNSNAPSSLAKMADAHRFPAIYYGFLHDQNGWDAFHG